MGELEHPITEEHIRRAAESVHLAGAARILERRAAEWRKQHRWSRWLGIPDTEAAARVCQREAERS